MDILGILGGFVVTGKPVRKHRRHGASLYSLVRVGWRDEDFLHANSGAKSSELPYAAV